MMTTTQYAAKHGISRSQVVWYISRGRLRATKIGRDWMVEDQPKPEQKKQGRPRSR